MNAGKGGERWMQDDPEERGRDDTAFVMMLFLQQTLHMDFTLACLLETGVKSCRPSCQTASFLIAARRPGSQLPS